MLASDGGLLLAQRPAPKPKPGAETAATAPSAAPSPRVERFLGVFASTDGLEVEVRADASGEGLVVRPRTPRTAQRLASGREPAGVASEANAAAEARIRRGLEPMAKQRGEADAEAFVDRKAMAAVQKVVDAAVGRVGAARDLAVVEVDVVKRRAVVQCTGQKGSVYFDVQWSASGRLASIVESKDAPSGKAFAVPRADWAERDHGAATISVEGRFAARVLVLEDASGLVELAWVRDLR